MKEKRKVINMGGGEYRLLKPKTNESNPIWYNRGEKKSLKSIAYLVENNIFDFEISEDIRKEIEDYKEKSARRIEKYSRKNGLENNLKN